jgi:hypothetical protein
VKNYVAGGNILLPEEVSLTVKPSKKQKGLYDVVYVEWFPNSAGSAIRRTVTLMKSMWPGVVSSSGGQKKTKVELRFTGTHEAVGSALGWEFIGWSPLGKLSIVEVLATFILSAGKTTGSVRDL